MSVGSRSFITTEANFLLQAVNDHLIALRLKPMNATPSAVVVSLAVASSEGDELAML